MSLSTFIAAPEVREKFSNTFHYPSLEISPKLICPPITKNYGLIGTAFDYLLRFMIEADNKGVITKEWVAEKAVDLTKGTDNFRYYSTILQEARNAYGLYLETKILDDKIMKAAILLAQLDPILRNKHVRFDVSNIGRVEKQDIEDLRNLAISAKLEIFKVKKLGSLNPTFGLGSVLVGGADADLIIDDTIIEIKTVKEFKLEKQYYNQLIGYYILSRIGSVEGYTKKDKINNLAIYFSRYATLVNFKVSDIMKDVDADEFILWFVKTAEQFRHKQFVDKSIFTP